MVYDYGSGLNAAISRLTSITDGATTLESYVYMGLSGVIQRMHPQNGIDLTYIGTPGDAGDQYAGLDRFGRVVDQNWTDGSTSVDRYTYTYDRNSNRTSKGNALNSALSEVYTYDSLNRLTGTQRNGSAHQSWDLDALGSSDSVTTDNVTEDRTHNSQNQLTQMGTNDLAFDANGNTITDQNGRTLVYDGWNRLVEAKNGETSLIRYEYDGLTRQVEQADTDQYFSALWQVIEERNASNATTVSNVFSVLYVDAMIARDRDTDANGSLDERLYAIQDANWNVTAIADESGDIAQRYVYDAYGKRIVVAANWTTTTEVKAWRQGHQGGFYDPVLTEKMLFRWRMYDVETMRWMTEDPLQYVDGLNSYSGIHSNPMTFADPSGTVVVLIHGVNTDAAWYNNADQGLVACQQQIIHFKWGDRNRTNPKQGGLPNYATDTVAGMSSYDLGELERTYMVEAVTRMKMLLGRLNRIKTEEGSSETITVIGHSQGTIITLGALQGGATVDNFIMQGSPLDIWPFNKASNDLLKAKPQIRGSTYNYWSPDDEWAFQKGGIGASGKRLSKMPAFSWITNREFGPGKVVNGYTLPKDGEFDEFDHSDYMASSKFFENIHLKDLGGAGDLKVSAHAKIPELKTLAADGW